MTNATTITLQLDEAHALALAQFVKRIGWTEFSGFAANDDEAADIRFAVDVLQQALAEAGFSPR